MPQLFIIAGPPGIGKSTNGKKFISTNIGILNHDALFIHYRAKGELDLQELSNLKANDFLLKIE
jgi:adenylate kinase family enzyme